MDELKPCPKCRSTDCHIKMHKSYYYTRYGDEWWGVKCSKCGYEEVSKLYDEPIDAVYAWNKRAEDERKDI